MHILLGYFSVCYDVWQNILPTPTISLQQQNGIQSVFIVPDSINIYIYKFISLLEVSASHHISMLPVSHALYLVHYPIFSNHDATAQPTHFISYRNPSCISRWVTVFSSIPASQLCIYICPISSFCPMLI